MPAESYSPPQVEIEQVITPSNPIEGRLLKACVVGGHAQLVRYSEASEKSQGSLGTYDPDNEVAISWPNKDVGAIIDLDYVEIYADDAHFLYFEDDIGSGSTINMVANYPNRIRSNSINFKANGSSYPRAAALLKDVAPGDVVYVRGVESAVTYEKTTYVKSLIGDIVAAVVGSAAADASNPATSAGSSNATKTAGDDNCVSDPANWTISHASYDGLADGAVNETYTIKVIQSSTGDDLTTARLKITSASGLDDVASVAPAALDAATSIGTRGLTVTFKEPVDTTACEAAAALAGISDHDLLLGQEWTVTVSQVYTKPVPTAGGTYSGTKDDTLIVTVTKGGDSTAAAGSRPQIKVTSTNGLDYSEAVELVDDGGGDTEVLAVGTKGVTITFAGEQFNKGDRFHIPLTAAKVGAYKTIELGHVLDSNILVSTDLHVKIFIKKSGVVISRERTGEAPLVNYEKSASEVTLKDGIKMIVPEWSSSVSLPMTSATLYAHYRAWKQDLVGSVFGAQESSAVLTAISGSLTPDNELKYGAFIAAGTSGGVEVRFTAVSDPSSIDAWADAIEVLGKEYEAYGLVPLTTSKAVKSLFEAHANSFSGSTINLWRVVWMVSAAYPTLTIVDDSLTDDDQNAMCTIADNPLASGTQYTLLTVSSGNADLLELGARIGDTVRTNYVDDGFGNLTYDEFAIESVQSGDQLILATANAVAVSVGQKFEIIRTLNLNEEADKIAETEGFTNMRVRYVLPDTVPRGGVTIPGYFLCCHLAGERASMYPHEPMTRLAISGFDAMPRSDRFTRDQLDKMAGNGVFIVYTNQRSKTIEVRHAVTTADTDVLEEREESVVSNLDELSYELYDLLNAYIGKSNVNTTFLDLLGTTIRGWIQTKQDDAPNDRIGPQFGPNTTLESLRQSATEKDSIVCDIDGEVPVGTNKIKARLGVTVNTIS